MSESYSYKCPSCGAKVNYNNKIGKWKCDYCGNSYDNLFKTDAEELDSEITLYKDYYYNECPNCGKTYYSNMKREECYSCHTKLNEKKEKIGGFINKTSISKSATDSIGKEISYIMEYLPPSYAKGVVKEEYIVGDIYSGSIYITNGTNTLKYFFVNTFIPHLDTDNYRVHYDFANAGFDSVDNLKFKETHNYNVLKESHDEEVNIDDVKKKLINVCKESFRVTYPSTRAIEVSDHLSVRERVLLQTLYSANTVDGKTYKSYVLRPRTGQAVKKSCSLDLPPIKGMNNKTINDKIRTLENKSSLLIGLGTISAIFLFFGFGGGIFLIPAFTIDISIAFIGILFYVLLFIAAIFGVVFGFKDGFKLKREIAFYKNSLRASEKDFYFNLVNNSNFVKKVGR